MQYVRSNSLEAQVANELRLWETVMPAERARLVNLCTYWIGNREAAEDLTQEALIEAWRHRQKLLEPAGYSRWLSAIARNVCLRWLRAQGRQSARRVELKAEADSLNLASLPGDEVDLEIELERDELADLLDRALALLPPDTREALVHKYIFESPQAEIAARLGVSEGAVEARLQRGKLTLHRILTTELYEQAAAYGLVESARDRWQQTRIWCPECGRNRLYGMLPQTTGEFELHCPRCSWDRDLFFVQSTRIPFFDGVKGYKPTLRRFMSWMDDYLRPALSTGRVVCWNCGHGTPLHLQLPPWAPRSIQGRRGVHVKCEACGYSSYAELDGLVMNLPQAERFWRRHPRIRALPQREIEIEGQPALLICYESVTGAAQLQVIVTRTSYEVLSVAETVGD